MVEKDGNYFNYSLSALGTAHNIKLVKIISKSWDFFKNLKSDECIMSGANQEAPNTVIIRAENMDAAREYMTYQAKAKG